MPPESPWKTAGALGSVGLSFVLAIVIGTAFGWWLDGTLGTSPWMFFLFFGFGVAAGVLNVYRTLSRYTRAQPPRRDPHGR